MGRERIVAGAALIGSLLICAFLASRPAGAVYSHALLDLYELKASDAKDYDRFGSSVAIDGGTAVAGASNASAAYVLQRAPDGTWVEADRLSPGDTAEPIRFGWTADISGSTIAVGADATKVIYIFERDSLDPPDWIEAKRLETGGGPEDGNGLDVAIEGDTVVIGYPASSGSCCAYIHQRDSDGVENWGRVKTLMAGDPGVHSFGGAVGLSGDWIAVSAVDADARIVVYLYRRDFGGQDNWGQFRKLVLDDDGGEEDVFEAHELLALDGNTLVAGSYDANVQTAGGLNQGQGVAYLFERDIPGSGDWVRTKKLVASDGHEYQWFGFSAAIGNDRLVVGAVWTDIDGRDRQGAAYVFQRDAGGAGNWGEVEKLYPAAGTAGAYFGASVAGNHFADFIGAPGASYGGGESQGKVFYAIRFVANHRLWLPQVRRP